MLFITHVRMPILLDSGFFCTQKIFYAGSLGLRLALALWHIRRRNTYPSQGLTSILINQWHCNTSKVACAAVSSIALRASASFALKTNFSFSVPLVLKIHFTNELAHHKV